MNARDHTVLVAGHICLDITPSLGGALPGPGVLHEVGDARLTLGGAVSNVGTTPHRLGHPVRLVGAVGRDGFGTLARDRLRGVFAGPSDVTTLNHPADHNARFEPHTRPEAQPHA